MSFILETQRLRLKPIFKSDFTTLHAIFIDPYVCKYLCDDKVLSLQQIEEMSSQSQKHFAEAGFGLWFIETKQEENIIGFVGLWYFFEETQPQLVYALLPHATKKGYATEAATRILEYAFNELGYNYVSASCDRPNLESQKLAIRLGMRQVEERIENDNPILFFRIDRLND